MLGREDESQHVQSSPGLAAKAMRTLAFPIGNYGYPAIPKALSTHI